MLPCQSELAETNLASKPGIEILPDLPLSNVIQHLPWLDRLRTERVSKRWRHLALAYGWTSLKYFSNGEFGKPKEQLELKSGLPTVHKLVELLRRCGDYVEMLHLFNISTDNVRPLVERCPNLSGIHLAGVMVDSDFIDYLRGIKRLKSVS